MAIKAASLFTFVLSLKISVSPLPVIISGIDMPATSRNVGAKSLKFTNARETRPDLRIPSGQRMASGTCVPAS